MIRWEGGGRHTAMRRWMTAPRVKRQSSMTFAFMLQDAVKITAIRSCCLIDFHGTGRICMQLLGLWLVLTGSSCSTLNSPWHLCPNWFLSLFLALSLSVPIVKHQMPQRKAATNSSKCCAALLGISQLNKTSLHLCIALYHSLCNYQGDMFEQRAINPIYYTLSSNPRTCAVKPGLSPCFPSPN